MNAEDVGDVVRTCGQIEDSLGLLEKLWVTTIEEEIKLDEALTTERHILRERADGKSDGDRKAWVEREIRRSDDYVKWVDLRAQKTACAAHFDVLSKRLSACQSVLKRIEADNGSGPRRGRRIAD